MMDGGHYTCDTRIDNTGHWLKCNDEQITFVSEQEVFDEKAYLLFYQRENCS